MAKLDNNAPEQRQDFGGNSGADRALFTFVERLERLAEEKAALGADMKEVMGEAKGQGFDTKILRKVLAARKMDSQTRQEVEAMFDTYWTAVERAENAQFAKSQADGG